MRAFVRFCEDLAALWVFDAYFPEVVREQRELGMLRWWTMAPIMVFLLPVAVPVALIWGEKMLDGLTRGSIHHQRVRCDNCNRGYTYVPEQCRSCGGVKFYGV